MDYRKKFSDFNYHYLPELVVTFFLLISINWIILWGFSLFQAIIGVSRNIFMSFTFSLIFLAIFGIVLFLQLSTYSVYSWWDKIKNIPYLSAIIRKFFSNFSIMTLQTWYPFLIVLPVVVMFYVLKTMISSTIYIGSLTVLIFFIMSICGVGQISQIKNYMTGLKILKSEKERDVETNCLHNAIIIVHNKDQIKIPAYGDNLDKLTQYFSKSERRYILYNCYTPDDFSKIVYNPFSLNLWIFGHGTKSSISFSTWESLKYAQLSDAPKKFFIGQFHCNCFNSPNEKSLCELIAYFGFQTGKLMAEEEIKNVIDCFVNIQRYPENQVDEFV